MCSPVAPRGPSSGFVAPQTPIRAGAPPRGPQGPYGGGPINTTIPAQKQPAGKQPPIVPPPGGWPTGPPVNDDRVYSKAATDNSGNPQPANGVGTATPPPMTPPGTPVPKPGAIDYSVYKGSTSPMDVYGRNPGGLPVGWDWDAYTAATGVKTHDDQGRPLDNTGNSIIWNPYGNNSQVSNPPASTPPPSTPPPTTPPPTTPPPGAPPPATTPPPATVPGQPVTGSPSGQPEVLVPPPAAPVQGAPVNSGVEQLVPPPVLPPITQPSVPKMGIAAPTFAPGGAPASSGSPVVNALMKRYRKNLWDF